MVQSTHCVVAIYDSEIGADAAVTAVHHAGLDMERMSISVKYELAVKAGIFLVLARGAPDIMEQARGVLGTTGASQLTAHAA